MRQAGRGQAEPASEPDGGMAAFFAQRQAGLGVVLVTVLACVAGFFAWQRFGPDVRKRSDYVLQPENVTLVGQPPWVKSDITQQALRDASLDAQLPLDDPELARRLARAFDVHPWVRSVDRVEVRSPAFAEVTITCRKPVAMVRVPGGLLPVDGEGVVLPSDEFTPDEAASYPVVAGVRSLPQGPAGSAWGDQAVEEAVAVVAVTAPEWAALNLVECRLQEQPEQRQWELVNAAGVAITFGASPGREPLGEPGMAEKIAALQTLAASGPVATATDLRDLVRGGDERSVAPIDAAAPADDGATEPPLTSP